MRGNLESSSWMLGSGEEDALRAMGIRCTAKEIFFAVVEGTTTEPQIIAKDKLKTPKSYEVPQALAWVRNHIASVLQEYSVAAAVVKTTEPIAGRQGTKSGTYMRCYYEGVCMEAVASRGIPVRSGPYATVSSLLVADSSRKYIAQDSFRGVSGWVNLNQEQQDATLAATAALRLAEEASHGDSHRDFVQDHL